MKEWKFFLFVRIIRRPIRHNGADARDRGFPEDMF